MADDPYTVLGVPRTATEDEIRRAYRKLAKQLHPDLNPDNRVAAEERFKKVSGAYEVVGDAEKRRQYDRGEIVCEEMVNLYPETTVEGMMGRMRATEHRVQIQALRLLAEGKAEAIEHAPHWLVKPEERELLERCKARAIAEYPNG